MPLAGFAFRLLRFLLVGLALFFSYMLFILPAPDNPLFGDIFVYSLLGWLLEYGVVLLSAALFGTIVREHPGHGAALLILLCSFLAAGGLSLLADSEQENINRFQNRREQARNAALAQSFKEGRLHYLEKLVFQPGTASQSGIYSNSLVYRTDSNELFVAADLSIQPRYWRIEKGYVFQASGRLEQARVQRLDVNRDSLLTKPLLPLKVGSLAFDAFLSRMLSWQPSLNQAWPREKRTLEFVIFAAGILLFSYTLAFLLTGRRESLPFRVLNWLAYLGLLVMPVFAMTLAWQILVGNGSGNGETVSPLLFWMRCLLIWLAALITLIFALRGSGKGGSGASGRRAEADEKEALL